MSAAKILVISCSLNPESRSRQLARAALAAAREAGAPAELVDLRDHPLPMCDGDASFSAPPVRELRARVADAAAILVAAPVYNYALNAAAKNLIELTGRAWKEKPVGFLCAAGGTASYMSPIGVANNLMFDFRCWIIPRFVYASRGAFDGAGELPPEILRRIAELVDQAIDIGEALAPERLARRTRARAARTRRALHVCSHESDDESGLGRSRAPAPNEWPLPPDETIEKEEGELVMIEGRRACR